MTETLLLDAGLGCFGLAFIIIIVATIACKKLYPKAPPKPQPIETEQPWTLLPRYRCHKEVWALKIKRVHPVTGGGGGAVLIPEEQKVKCFRVGTEYLLRHKPYPGGYFVCYEDGYQSFSPAKAFEAGYTPIP
ncbi:MAG TPA: hypothetical protein VN776_16390 [Terracidiphilus sp.]|nr:hypothetical protein [Terracidiphilus sp.]